MSHPCPLRWTLYPEAIGLNAFQVWMTENRQGHDESKRDSQVAAEANGVLQSCSKAVCSPAHRRDSFGLGLCLRLPDKKDGVKNGALRACRFSLSAPDGVGGMNLLRTEGLGIQISR